MKEPFPWSRLLSLLIIFLSLVSFSFAQGVREISVDPNGAVISGPRNFPTGQLKMNGMMIPDAALAKPALNEIWISNRHDGMAGDGRRENPYDGSTQVKFDALMQSISASTHIHLNAGVFYTKRVTPKENWIIEGAGKFLTTISLANGFAAKAAAYRVIGNNAFMSGTKPVGYLNYYSVRNLTIDCNKANQPVYINATRGAKLYAIRGGSNNADIINVRALNIWNYSGRGLESEGFPMSVEHDNSASKTDLVTFDGCDVIAPRGYHSAISAFTNPAALGGSFRVVIKNCFVTDHLIGSCFSPVGAIDTEIYGNTAYNCGTASTMDTWNFVNVRFFNNRLIKMRRGLNMYGNGNYKDIAIYNNYFDLDGSAIGPTVGSGSRTISGLQIRDNTIIQRSRTQPAISFNAGTSGYVRDNIISEVIATDLSATSLGVRGNLTSNKVPLSLGRP